MAETQTAESGSSDDIYKSIREVEPAPATPFADIEAKGKSVTDQLGVDARNKLKQDTRIIDRSEREFDADRTIARRHFNAEGVEADRMQPWDAEHETAKFYTSPIEAFGSLGSVFGILASAFTHAPMQNALSASAAAMNAIKENDDKGYERAHTAWKDNMDLVQKRFNMQHSMYTDALSLMNTDATAARIKLQNAALRFGDQKTLALLDAGMDADVINMMSARYKQMEGMQQVADKMDESAFRRQAFDSLQKDFQQRAGREPNPAETVEMWNYSHGIREPWQQQLMSKFLLAHQGEPDIEEKAAEYSRSLRPSGRSLYLHSGENEDPSQAFAQAVPLMEGWKRGEFKAGKPLSADQAFTQKFMDNHPDSTEVEFAEAFADFKQRQHVAQSEGKPQKPEDVFTQKFKVEYPNATADEFAQAFGKFKREQHGGGNFTDSQLRQLRAVPALMDHLRTLDYFAHVTGPIKGVPSEIAAVYGGLNDPAAVFEAAQRGARAAAADWGGSGRLKLQVENMLNTLPKTYQDARFNKVIAQQTMHDVSNEAQSFVSLLEKSGKQLPETVLEKYRDSGIFPESTKNLDPRKQLRSDPMGVDDTTLQSMRRYKGSLSVEEQKALDAEVRRRALLWEQEHGR